VVDVDGRLTQQIANDIQMTVFRRWNDGHSTIPVGDLGIGPRFVRGDQHLQQPFRPGVEEWAIEHKVSQIGIRPPAEQQLGGVCLTSVGRNHRRSPPLTILCVNVVPSIQRCSDLSQITRLGSGVKIRHGRPHGVKKLQTFDHFHTSRLLANRRNRALRTLSSPGHRSRDILWTATFASSLPGIVRQNDKPEVYFRRVTPAGVCSRH
jgi:hypothetical protein